MRGALVALGARSCLGRRGAQQSALVGDWFLTLDERRAVHTGTLTIESNDGSLVAFVDGGPGHVQARRRHDRARVRHARRRRPAAAVTRSAAAWTATSSSGVLTPPLDAPQGTLARRAARRAAARTAAARRFHGRLVAHVVGPGSRDARLHAGRPARRRRVPLPRRSVAALRVARASCESPAGLIRSRSCRTTRR